jgi:pre-mRNA-splicing factor CWC22
MKPHRAQDMSENMGLRALNARLSDPDCAPWFGNLFPRDSPRSMRFAINFFTSIGLGGLTDALRAHLAELPKLLAAQREAAAAAAAAAGGKGARRCALEGAPAACCCPCCRV